MQFTNDMKPCSSCGRMVNGVIRFIGEPEYHCRESEPFGCMPKSISKIISKEQSQEK